MTHGKIIVFTGPSAVGKATVEKYLFKNPTLKLGFSISATTRSPRPNEKEGKHYFYISDDKFDEMNANDEFIETSEHFHHKYGTLKSEIEKIINQKQNAFLEIETNGAVQIIENKDSLNGELITIFLAPPSLEVLETRIRNRATETEAQIKTRLSRAKKEIEHTYLYQHVVINDDPQRAADEIALIILGDK